MKILLDENLPRKFKQAFSEHLVSTVQEMGWSGVQNGKLLALAEGIFDVLLTVDKSIPHQQNLNNKQIILITLIVKHNKPEHLLPLVPAVKQAMANATPGQVIHIGQP